MATRAECSKVEPVSIAASRLCEITFNAMWKGICMVKPGAHFGDIGYAIQQYVGPTGCSIVREFRWSRRGEEVSTKNLLSHTLGRWEKVLK